MKKSRSVIYLRSAQPLQILDIKTLAEIEHKQRIQCQRAILFYKAWRTEQAALGDEVIKYYTAQEGRILRTHAVNLIHAYWQIRQDFRQAFKQYLEENCVTPSRFQQAA